MVRTSRWSRLRLVLPAMAVALAFGAWSTPAHAQGQVRFVIPGFFDNSQTTGLDYSVGNGLASATNGANLGAPEVGDTFTFYYQATITAVNVVGGQAPAPGNDTLADGIRQGDYELTAIAAINQVVTDVDGTAVSFGLAADTSANYFRVFFDDGSDLTALPADNATQNALGTGFDDGVLVFEARPDNLSVSDFEVNPNVAPVDVDPSGPNFGGITSVTGSGNTSLNATVVTANPTFFPAGAFTLVGVNFSPLLNAPFTSTAASDDFSAGATGATGDVAPSIGSINGFSGPDIILQVDANSSFIVTVNPVPEPATMSLALTAAGMGGLGLLRARRRRNRSTVA